MIQDGIPLEVLVGTDLILGGEVIAAAAAAAVVTVEGVVRGLVTLV